MRKVQAHSRTMHGVHIRRAYTKGQIIALVVALVGIGTIIGAFLIFWVPNKIRDKSVDIDLTAMSTTVASGTVNEMVWEKQAAYLGKVIKVAGTYSTQVAYNTTYHYVAFPGSDACCPNGIEFMYDGTLPALNKKIEVVGKWSKYTDKNDNTVYYYIKATSLEII
jgi:hypothetical protein